MKLPAVFERYRSAIDAEMRSALADHASPMYDMLRYHLGWVDRRGQPAQQPSGKALRPTLCLLACESTRTDPHTVLPAAAAIEMVHNFSLIHDDIQDDDQERHHRPTVWALWGKPQAINAGTAMRVLASLTLLRLVDRGVSVQQQLRALRLMDESCLRLIEGQYLDISFESRIDIVVRDYLSMIEGKTATLMACSLEMGAMLGSGDERTIEALRAYGLNLGFAFQIRDDVLGIWGEEEKTGKPVGSDIRRRKKSFPIVFALEKAEGKARTELERIYRDKSSMDGAVATVLDILDQVRAGRESQALAERYRDAALAKIAGIELPQRARQDLEEMATFLAERDH